VNIQYTTQFKKDSKNKRKKYQGFKLSSSEAFPTGLNIQINKDLMEIA